LLSYLIINGTDACTVVLVASAGNWLGGMSSYAIIWITALSMLAGKFLRYVIWGLLTGFVF
jgi:membrane protein YqaA with SNARE-associated domain